MTWLPVDENTPREGRIMLCDEGEVYWPIIGEYVWDDPKTGEPRFQSDGGPSGTYDLWSPLPPPPGSDDEFVSVPRMVE